jgi:hypothetical protein
MVPTIASEQLPPDRAMLLSSQSDGRNFPTKLHECLTELEQQGLGHIAGFQPHGRSFLVHKPQEFMQQVLPR